jgi:hypothetical protein
MKSLFYILILLSSISELISNDLTIYSPSSLSQGGVSIYIDNDTFHLNSLEKIVINMNTSNDIKFKSDLIDTIINLSGMNDDLFIRINSGSYNILTGIGSPLSVEKVEKSIGIKESAQLSTIFKNRKTNNNIISLGIYAPMPGVSNQLNLNDEADATISGLGIGGIGIIGEVIFNNNFGLSIPFASYDSRGFFNQSSDGYISTFNTLGVIPFYRFDKVRNSTYSIRVGLGLNFMMNNKIHDNFNSVTYKLDNNISYESNVSVELNLNSNIYFTFGVALRYAEYSVSDNILQINNTNNIGINIISQFSYILIK